MPVTDVEHSEGPEGGGARRRWRLRGRIALGLAAVVLVGGSAAWMGRERIASDVIDGYLADHRVPATYKIVSLTPDRQVIENLVVGDPARPDLTARRMVIDIGVGWSGPTVRHVSLEGARLFASYHAGTFSLGALDPLVFTGSKATPALPAIDVTLRDARALIVSDYGRVGEAGRVGAAG